MGRAPRRRDFREDREKWEQATGLQLPNANQIETRWKGWNAYLEAAGLEPAGRSDYAHIEKAAIDHVLEAHPDFELVRAEANAFDGYLGDERVEVKGSLLASRTVRNSRVYYFNFKTHNRDLDKTVDRLICVGLGVDPTSKELVPLVRFEFPKVALGLVSRKATVMVYTSSIFGPGTSLYGGYVTWKAPLRAHEVADYLGKAPEEE